MSKGFARGRTALTRNGRPSTTKFGWVYKDPRWKAVRKLVLERDKWRCTNCGCSVRTKFAARVDHIVAVSADISLAFTITNLRTLCVPCDAVRHMEKGGGGRAVERKGVDEDGWPIADG